jgi:hypothetical protein
MSVRTGRFNIVYARRIWKTPSLSKGSDTDKSVGKGIHEERLVLGMANLPP